MSSTNKNIEEYFALLGLEAIDAQIYTTLCQIGNQPASTIARRLDTERTKVYRHLQKMSKLGIVNTSQSRGVATFYVDDTRGIEQLIDQKMRQASLIE